MRVPLFRLGIQKSKPTPTTNISYVDKKFPVENTIFVLKHNQNKNGYRIIECRNSIEVQNLSLPDFQIFLYSYTDKLLQIQAVPKGQKCKISLQGYPSSSYFARIRCQHENLGSISFRNINVEDILQ